MPPTTSDPDAGPPIEPGWRWVNVLRSRSPGIMRPLESAEEIGEGVGRHGLQVIVQHAVMRPGLARRGEHLVVKVQQGVGLVEQAVGWHG